MGGGTWLSNQMCSSETVIFEKDASAIKGLMSGTTIPFKKTNCQALTLQLFLIFVKLVGTK